MCDGLGKGFLYSHSLNKIVWVGICNVNTNYPFLIQDDQPCGCLSHIKMPTASKFSSGYLKFPIEIYNVCAQVC